MNSKVFLLLGGNKLNYGIYKKYKKRGYAVYVIDWNQNPSITGDRHFQIDVKDYTTIIETLRKIGVWENVAFAYSSIDLAVPSVAMINRAIGLRTISDEGLKYSSSKSMMTYKWNELGLLNRMARRYDKFSEDIIDFNKEKSIIIKPDNSASSRGITILKENSNISQISEAFQKAKDEASNNIVVVEEFVSGTEYTIEMIGDSYGNVSVYAISRKSHTINTNRNKIAIKLHYNSEDMIIQKKLAEYGIRCYRALNFSSSLGHLEVLLKDNGEISPIEIGARSSGYIASDLVDIVSGADFLNDLMLVQNGKRVENGLHYQTDKSSMYFFYDFPPKKKVLTECNLLDFCDSSIVSRYSDRASIVVGKEFDNIENDNARLGYEVLEGPKELMTKEYIEQAEKRMLEHMMGE